MSKTITLKCPVYIEEVGTPGSEDYQPDDICGNPIEVDAWPAERMTHWYPGSPAGFEVVEAGCGHAAVIEERYYDTILEQIADRERSAAEYTIDRYIEEKLDREWERRFRV